MDAADALADIRAELELARPSDFITRLLAAFDAELIAILPPGDLVEPQIDIFNQSETWEV